MSNREKLREMFNNKLSYSDIKQDDINNLISILKRRLKDFDNEGFTMKLCRIRKSDIKFENDTLVKCYLMVDGGYFKRREAISFNPIDTKGKTFVGIAGWASTTNSLVFIESMEEWINSF